MNPALALHLEAAQLHRESIDNWKALMSRDGASVNTLIFGKQMIEHHQQALIAEEKDASLFLL
jgi:hypothetical protein